MRTRDFGISPADKLFNQLDALGKGNPIVEAIENPDRWQTSMPVIRVHRKPHRAGKWIASQCRFQVALGLPEGGRMMKRPKVELSVPVEADSDTQRALERLIQALEKQGFKIIRKDKKLT